jgi:hypothetical protein
MVLMKMHAGAMQGDDGTKVGQVVDWVVLVNVAQVLGWSVGLGVDSGLVLVFVAVVPRSWDRVMVMRVWALLRDLLLLVVVLSWAGFGGKGKGVERVDLRDGKEGEGDEVLERHGET